VIQEETQRAKKTAEVSNSESFGSSVAHVKHFRDTDMPQVNVLKYQEMEREIMDLKIANRGKDYLIDQLKGERTGFFERLLSANRTLGQLHAKLHRLDKPQ
jgi:hypothetical protein